MRHIILALLLIALGGASLAAAPEPPSGPPVDGPPLGLVPLPAKLERREGRFPVGDVTAVVLDSRAPGTKRIAKDLAALLQRATGELVLFLEGNPKEEPVRNTILLTTRGADPEANPESYELAVRPDYVAIRAPAAAGLFYGVQTLRQLLPPEIELAEPPDGVDWRIPAMRIEDEPRFSWRGMHLDVGRHFFPPDQIRAFLDLLALHKFNTFHWHLTEDQGWRIEIEKWPKLVEVGSRRAESPREGARGEGDGKPYGGHYTQDEIREIVAYARERFITIVPEIEMPGHSQAAIAAYPQFGNRPDEPVPVRTRWGVSEHIYNVEEETFDFLEDVLDEVCGLFPGTFIHIGGDEAPKKQWEESKAAQRRMKELGLKDGHALQSWFIGRIERYLAGKGRRLIGWDEIQEGGLPPGAAMMVWRSWKYGVDAVRLGHDIVMSPTSHCYLDYYQGDPRHEPEAIGGLLPLERVYAFEPVPPELTAEEAEHVLGAQGNLWTEYIFDFDRLMYMAFPRAAAMAEVVWTPADRRSYDDFLDRWGTHSARLDALGVNYRLSPPVPVTNAVIIGGEPGGEGAAGEVAFHPPPGRQHIRTTTGRMIPADSSPLYDGPIRMTEPGIVTAAVFTPDGRRSVPVQVEVAMQSPLTAGGEHDGLDVEVFKGRFERVPEFDALRRLRRRHVDAVGLEVAGDAERYALRFTAVLSISREGIYTFETTSDDGSVLKIAGARVVDNDGAHGAVTRSGRVRLQPGRYDLELGYFQAGGAGSLELRVGGPDLPLGPPPEGMLTGNLEPWARKAPPPDEGEGDGERGGKRGGEGGGE